jgi:beta-glucosidase
VSLLDGLKQAPGVTVRHEPGCKLSLTSPFRTFKEDDELIARAAKLAAECAIAVVCIGCPEKYETEGSDRPSMALPGRQDDLVRAVLAANPRTVVVLFAGAPLELPWLEQAPALLLANYPGLEGGAALARLLLGQANPSGKLTVSWPARLQDSPAYLNGPYPEARQVRYGEGLFVGYRYFDAVDRPARFPFGHGLSYTTFAYGEMKVNHGGTEGTEKKKDSLELRVSVVISVTNSGARAGAEVVQLYVRDVQSSLPRPPKELKGFRKVWLEPGETKEVRFELDGRAFAFYHPQAKGWVVEPGEFELIAGASSQDIRAKKAISF